MDIDGIILEQFRAGWVVKTPQVSKDKKTGAPKTTYKDAFFPRLEQCLWHIRDNAAKGCTTALELIALLERAERIDLEVLAYNGLVQPRKSIAA